MLDLMTSRRDTANKRKMCEKGMSSWVQHFALYFLHVVDAGTSAWPAIFSRGLQCQSCLSYSRVSPRQPTCVRQATQNLAPPRNQPGMPRAGGKGEKKPLPPPPSKGGTAKNAYSILERRTLSCRVTWASSERVTLYNRQMM